MVLDEEIMTGLCDLYPETDRNLKYRSLDRRAYFMKHMDEQWDQIQKENRLPQGKKVTLNPIAQTINDEGHKQTAKLIVPAQTADLSV